MTWGNMVGAVGMAGAGRLRNVSAAIVLMRLMPLVTVAALAVGGCGGERPDPRGARSATPKAPSGRQGREQGYAKPGRKAQSRPHLYYGVEKPDTARWGISIDENYERITSWPKAGIVRRVGGPSRDGRYKLRFEVKPRPKTFRSEVAREPVPMGSDVWYAFSINVPKEWRYDPGGSILAQWHAKVARQVNNYPVVSLYVIKDGWQVRLNWNSRGDTSKGAGWGRKRVRLGPVRKGMWTDWVLHAKWSYGPDGLLEMWHDGKKVISHRGPNEYVNESGPYFKMGIYHPEWKHADARIPPGTKPLVSYADAIRFALNGNYEAVRPR